MKTITKYGALLVALSLFSWNQVNAAAPDRGLNALAAGKIKSKVQADIKAIEDNPKMDLGQQLLLLGNILKNARSLKPPKKIPLAFNGYTKKGWATLRGQLLDQAGIDINGPIETDKFVNHLTDLMTEITKISDEGPRKLDPDSVKTIATILSDGNFPLMFSGKMYDAILDFITENFHIQIPVKNPEKLAEALKKVNAMINFPDNPKLKPRYKQQLDYANFVEAYAEAMEAGLLYSAYKDIANEVEESRKLKHRTIEIDQELDAQEKGFDLLAKKTQLKQLKEALAEEKTANVISKAQIKNKDNLLKKAENILAAVEEELDKIPPMYEIQKATRNNLPRTVNQLVTEFKETKRNLTAEKEISTVCKRAIKKSNDLLDGQKTGHGLTKLELEETEEDLAQEKGGHALTKQNFNKILGQFEELIEANETLTEENKELRKQLRQSGRLATGRDSTTGSDDEGDDDGAAHSGLDSDNEGDDGQPRRELGPIGGDSTPTSFSDLTQGNFGNIVRPGIPTIQDIRENRQQINALLRDPIENLIKRLMRIPIGSTIAVERIAIEDNSLTQERSQALIRAITETTVLQSAQAASGAELARLRTLTPAQLEQVRNLFNVVQTLYYGQQDGSPVQVQHPDRSHVVIIGKTNITLDIGEIIRALAIRGKAKTETTSENLTQDVNEAGRALESVAENTVPLTIDLAQVTPVDLVQIAGGRATRVLLTAAHEIMNGLAREAQLAPPGKVAQLGDSSLWGFSKESQRGLNTFAQRLRNIASRDVTPITKALNTNEQSMLDGPRNLDIERLGEIFEQGNNNTTERTTRVTDQELEEQLESLAAICELLGSNVTENAPLNVFNYQGSFYVYRGPTVQLNQIIEAGKVPLQFKGNRILNISKVTGTPTTTNNTIRNLQQLTKILRRLGKL